MAPMLDAPAPGSDGVHGGHAALREAHSRLQLSLDHAPEAVFWMTKAGGFAYVNHAACEALGYAKDELARLAIWDIDPDFPRERWARQWEQMRKAGKRTFETRHRRKDGTIFPVEVSVCHVAFEGFEHHVAFVRDLSERRRQAADRDRLVEQLNQAHKLESVGRLAGGVAHDFNNMLTVILGYTEVVLRRLGDHPVVPELREIEAAAQRSRDLTQKLLSFSRKQVIEPRLVRLDSAVAQLVKTVRRLIGDDIEVRTVAPAEGAWCVRIDPSQFDQLLVNLAANARDAMPDGGKLCIETANVVVDEAMSRTHPELVCGLYVALIVSDTGVGMDGATRAHIFEPFFSTKDPSKGTGLGLSTVYGIVKQNGGAIDVYSELGRGTTFKVHLPAVQESPDNDEKPRPASLVAGAGRVLLVEDNEQVRRLTATMLEALGYEVEAAAAPDEALAWARSGRSYDALVSDMAMPGMNGVELAAALAPLFPALKVLFVSGYTSNAMLDQGRLRAGVHFLGKPFTLEQLGAKLAAVLRTSD